jgi:hypothetical protein
MGNEHEVKVRIALPDGSTRYGWWQTWRKLLVWEELDPHGPDDSDPSSEPKETYMAHAHESEVDSFEPMEWTRA